MAEEKSINFEFRLDTGETLVETKGFKGQECLKAAEEITKVLGTKTGFSPKREWYENELKSGRNVNTNLCG